MTQDIETICAPATAAGGALAVIRISGPEAITIASSICNHDVTSLPSNKVHHVQIQTPNVSQSESSSKRETIDDVLLTIFRAPHSYTGEDSVEISCHGSRYIVQKILDLLIQNGCRMAQPGEYTMRAYLNGRQKP